MILYGELSEATIERLKFSRITWDYHKRSYFTQLHKEFYLKETEPRQKNLLRNLNMPIYCIKKAERNSSH